MPFTLYSSVDEWEASALANAPSQEHQHLAQALKDVLSAVTTPAEGASRIASVVNPSSDPYPLYLWTIMRITSATEGFSEDVNNTGRTITSRPSYGEEFTTAPGEAIGPDGLRVWADLPDFREEIRELWNAPADKFECRMHHLSEAEVIRQWSSINAFAIWTIRHALEEGDDHPGFEPQLHIPAAAQWIRILGTQLRDEGITFGADEQRMARGGDLYDVDANGYGFTSVRWALWMDRFPHYSQDTRLSAEIRRIAAETADSMQWIVVCP
ncbi:hypothetical protein B0J12DRAFT_782095 [Macrophomina phaseolina]|uniref:Uncharacterized protein n=1 Tax=Macrophomina phaseolina TaxID=35725 RepID=A0ABQ8GN19_9PEZI|nr:hypothetical protein B0J12DRAFT_782095 [Macrophomina phaseolina]